MSGPGGPRSSGSYTCCPVLLRGGPVLAWRDRRSSFRPGFRFRFRFRFRPSTYGMSPLYQSLNLLGSRELHVLERGQQRPRAGPAVLEDGVAVDGAAPAQTPQPLLRLAVRHEGPALDAVRRAPLVLEPGRARERVLQQVVDDADDPLAVLA